MRVTVTVDLTVDEDKFRDWHRAVDDVRVDVAGTFAALVDEGKLAAAGIDVEGWAVR
jgi:hypothetical protein